MSGGKWNYIQFKINDIIDDIKSEINKSGKKLTIDEQYSYFTSNEYYHKYSDEVIKEFENAINILKKAETYIHNIDYLFSGDIGDDRFLQNIKNEK